MKLVLDENPKNPIDRVVKKVKRVARDFQRSKIRTAIVQTPPAPPVDFTTFDYRVHMLVCKRDLKMAICACKSLILASGKTQPFIFHDDGSLEDTDVNELATQFPQTKVIRYAQSLGRAKDSLGENSLLYQYRLKGVMMLKLLDIRLFAETEKVIIMDSDIVFFKNPEALLQRASDVNASNAFNKDIAPAYMMEITTLETLAGVSLLPELNAGLSVVNVNTIDFKRIEAWLKALDGKNFIMHRIEQSLMAMLSAASRYGTEYLPAAYDVSYFKDVSESVCKHYVGRIRHGFELEGLSFLLQNDFRRKWLMLIANKYGQEI